MGGAGDLATISTSKTQRVTNGRESTVLRSSLARKSLAPHLPVRKRKVLSVWGGLMRGPGATARAQAVQAALWCT